MKNDVASYIAPGVYQLNQSIANPRMNNSTTSMFDAFSRFVVKKQEDRIGDKRYIYFTIERAGEKGHYLFKSYEVKSWNAIVSYFRPVQFPAPFTDEDTLQFVERIGADVLGVLSQLELIGKIDRNDIKQAHHDYMRSLVN